LDNQRREKDPAPNDTKHFPNWICS